jgi:hypothetical protein
MAAPKPATDWYLTLGSTCTVTGVLATVSLSGTWTSVGVVTPGVVSHSCTVVGFAGGGGAAGAAVAVLVIGITAAAAATAMVNNSRVRITRCPLFTLMNGGGFGVHRFRAGETQSTHFVRHKV